MATFAGVATITEHLHKAEVATQKQLDQSA